MKIRPEQTLTVLTKAKPILEHRSLLRKQQAACQAQLRTTTRWDHSKWTFPETIFLKTDQDAAFTLFSCSSAD